MIKWSNFSTGGNKLQTTVKMDEARAEVKVDASKPAAASSGTQDLKADVPDALSTSALAALQSDVQPVGHDYVEEVGVLQPHCSSSRRNRDKYSLVVTSE